MTTHATDAGLVWYLLNCFIFKLVTRLCYHLGHTYLIFINEIYFFLLSKTCIPKSKHKTNIIKYQILYWWYISYSLMMCIVIYQQAIISVKKISFWYKCLWYRRYLLTSKLLLYKISSYVNYIHHFFLSLENVYHDHCIAMCIAM